MRTYYLNQTGHRWRNYVDGKPEKVRVFSPVLRTERLYSVRYWEAIGNVAVPYAQIKGKLEQLTESAVDGAWMINNQENRDIKWGRKAV